MTPQELEKLLEESIRLIQRKLQAENPDADPSEIRQKARELARKAARS